jgi:hypothetical protein
MESLEPLEPMPAPKVYSCPLCSFTSNTSGNVSKHKRRHLGVRSFACEAPGCGKAFMVLAELRRHARIHTGGLPCPYSCGYTAATRWSLNAHTKQCPAGAGLPPPPAPTFVCGLLGCTFTSTRTFSITDHQRRMHDPAKGNALACKSCEFTTASHSELLSHVRMHSGSARAAQRAAAKATAAGAEDAAAAEIEELAGLDE